MEDYIQTNIYYQEGRVARKTNIKLTDCPHSVKQIKELWQLGWDEEDKKQQKLGGKRVLR
jgi:hypothetical protein